MTGYCQNCHIIVNVVSVETVRLPNLRFVNKAKCSVCSGDVWNKIADAEIILRDDGHKCPKEVYLGKDNPAKIIKDAFGQVFVEIGASGVKVEKGEKPKKGGVVETVEDILKGINDGR